MIVAYAQASDRQGVDAALDGVVVRVDEPRFAEMRKKAVALNLGKPSVRIRDVEVRYGHGIVRLELSGTDDPDSELSPIVVVAHVDLVRGHSETARRAVESVAALARACDVAALDAGFALGARASIGSGEAPYCDRCGYGSTHGCCYLGGPELSDFGRRLQFGQFLVTISRRRNG